MVVFKDAFAEVFQIFEALFESGELESDDDGQKSNDESVDNQGNKTGVTADERFDVDFDSFFDDVVPSESGDQAEARGG